MRSIHRRTSSLLAALLLGAGFGLVPATASAAASQLITGTLADGATYRIEVPSGWNGGLVLYSHGYQVGPANPALDVGDPVTGAWLLGHGYALAGSSYATTGWALQQAIPDQIAVLDVFSQQVGRPSRTIAWGHSLGGMITAALVQLHPDRFAGAIPMCGVVGGGIGAWNQALDGAYAFKTLVAPASSLQLVNITDPQTNLVTGLTLLGHAQATPQGRARIALAAALGDIPGWYDPASPQPAASDVGSQEANQFAWFNNPDFFFSLAARAELEARAGGNFSWNTGVDYRRQLAKSTGHDEVAALYALAGLNLSADLDALNAGTRITAAEDAREYVARFITFNGDLDMPVLTMHTTGDGLVQVDHEQAYQQVVRNAGEASLLRQTYVHRAGHCTFSPAETIAGFTTLVHRLDSGRWGDSTTAEEMNTVAVNLGLGPSSFVQFRPPVFLRPFFGGDRN